jgi:hypothetical protein
MSNRRQRRERSDQPTGPGRDFAGTDLVLEAEGRNVALARMQLVDREAELVAVMIDRGWSWNRISRSVGVPVPTIIRRYGKGPS